MRACPSRVVVPALSKIGPPALEMINFSRCTLLTLAVLFGLSVQVPVLCCYRFNIGRAIIKLL